MRANSNIFKTAISWLRQSYRTINATKVVSPTTYSAILGPQSSRSKYFNPTTGLAVSVAAFVTAGVLLDHKYRPPKTSNPLVEYDLSLLSWALRNYEEEKFTPLHERELSRKVTDTNSSLAQLFVSSLRSLSNEAERLQGLSATEEQAKDIMKITTYAMEAATLVRDGELDEFRNRYTKLTELTPLPEVFNDVIIDLCTCYARFSFLKFLRTNPHAAKSIHKNKKAMRLLSHPCGDNIEHVVGQFTGVGRIKGDGAEIFMGVRIMLDIEEALGRIQRPEPSSLDEATDIHAILRDAQTRAQIAANERKHFHNLAILDCYEAGETYQYLRKLSEECEKSNTPVNGTILLYGAHFTCARIQMTKNAAGKRHIKMLYIDSLGGHEEANYSDFLVDRIFSMFPDATTEFYIGEDVTQTRAAGCSVFALENVYLLAYLDATLEMQPAYQGRFRKGDAIYAYCKNNITATRKDYPSYPRDPATDDFYKDPLTGNEVNKNYTYHVVGLPFLFSGMIQTLNSKKANSIYGSSRILGRSKGFYPRVEESSAANQAELAYPRTARHPEESLQQFLERNIVTAPHFRPQIARFVYMSISTQDALKSAKLKGQVSKEMSYDEWVSIAAKTCEKRKVNDAVNVTLSEWATLLMDLYLNSTPSEIERYNNFFKNKFKTYD